MLSSDILHGSNCCRPRVIFTKENTTYNSWNAHFVDVHDCWQDYENDEDYRWDQIDPSVVRELEPAFALLFRWVAVFFFNRQVLEFISCAVEASTAFLARFLETAQNRYLILAALSMVAHFTSTHEAVLVVMMASSLVTQIVIDTTVVRIIKVDNNYAHLIVVYFSGKMIYRGKPKRCLPYVYA